VGIFQPEALGDAECKIQADVVNARIKKFREKFRSAAVIRAITTLFSGVMLNGAKHLAVTYCAGRPDNQRFFASLRMTGNAGASLNHPEFHPSCFADHVLVPRRVPNKLDIGFIDAVDG
jgi:hypothetical protein